MFCWKKKIDSEHKLCLEYNSITIWLCQQFEMATNFPIWLFPCDKSVVVYQQPEMIRQQLALASLLQAYLRLECFVFFACFLPQIVSWYFLLLRCQCCRRRSRYHRESCQMTHQEDSIDLSQPFVLTLSCCTQVECLCLWHAQQWDFLSVEWVESSACSLLRDHRSLNRTFLLSNDLQWWDYEKAMEYASQAAQNNSHYYCCYDL